jgi:hypothetical protein
MCVLMIFIPGDQPRPMTVDAGTPAAMLSECSGAHLLITGTAPRPEARALLGAVATQQAKEPDRDR